MKNTVYYFSIPAVTNYHKPSCLQWHIFIAILEVRSSTQVWLSCMGEPISWPSAASGEQAYSLARGPFLHLQIQPRPLEPSHHITLTSFHGHTSFWIFSLPLLRTAVITLGPPRKSSIIPIQGCQSAILVPSAVVISNFSHNLINDPFQGIRTWTCLRGHYLAYHIWLSTDRETILRCNYI